MKREYLEKVYKNQRISIYEIKPFIENLKRFIVSTKYTSKILNLPEIYGTTYIENLKTGMKLILHSSFFKSMFKDVNESTTNVLVFLRGGLNFSLYELLYKEYGFKKHTVSFMTSERYKKKEHWRIKHDQYRKFVIMDNMNIFSGDVVATGTTLENGLNILKEYVEMKNIKIKKFVFFTIGSKKAEDIFIRFKKYFKDTEFYLIYLEGRFKLVENENEFRICIPETDLVRKGGLISPEFEISSYNFSNSFIERCIIYDVGARAFNYKDHIKEVINYWKSLIDLNLSFEDILYERWRYFGSDKEIMEEKKFKWRNVREDLIRKAVENYRELEHKVKNTNFKKFALHRIKKLEEEL
ncbi:MAG: hypothetical protein DRI36_06705 [Caldiserica bacterium]|nr:MAG: hypothetical protein DRI36_06705 [Caldisericota bacterium]